jgi:hypothetical protein
MVVLFFVCFSLPIAGITVIMMNGAFDLFDE